MLLFEKGLYNTTAGAVAELADAADLKSAGGDTVRVRPPLAPQYMVYWGKNRLKTLYMGAFGTPKRSVLYVFKDRQPADCLSFEGK
jgi:hypothetical protein